MAFVVAQLELLLVKFEVENEQRLNTGQQCLGKDIDIPGS
jgi:hypothetical protein